MNATFSSCTLHRDYSNLMQYKGIFKGRNMYWGNCTIWTIEILCLQQSIALREGLKFE